MSFYICTAGTSLMGGPFKRDRFTTLQEQIATKIAADEDATHGEIDAFLKKVSAETNGLTRSDCGPSDEVLILASDTADGQACAKALADLITAKLGAPARVTAVGGLQVTSGEKFRQSGIRNLIRTVLRETRNARAHGEAVVLNVTGGFKGVVPYMTLLGMFEDVEIIYVYDFSDTLVRLPALPVRFDAERIAFALPALQVLNNAKIMAEAEFHALLPGRGWNDDPIFAQLIEQDGGMVALSGAGELALAGCAPSAKLGRLLLHRRARQSTTLNETHAQHALGQIIYPHLRSIPHHCARYAGKSDMLVWKEFGGLAPRIYYSVDGPGDVYVAEILTHDEHEREVVNGPRRIWREDYAADGFEEYRPPVPPVHDAYGEALEAFLQHNDSDRSLLEKRLATAEHELETLREQHAKAKASNNRLQRDLDEANERNGTLSGALAEAEQASGRLLAAASFAADAHRRQRRKDVDATPYVNHVIEVARILAEEGGVTDSEVLCAALLHDTIEDTTVAAQELQREFGKRVRHLVEGLTDDKALPNDVRKRLQIEHAAGTPPDARLIKLGDKIANLRDIMRNPPADWPIERRREYVSWAGAVVDGLGEGGTECQSRLRAVFDRIHQAALERIDNQADEVKAGG